MSWLFLQHVSWGTAIMKNMYCPVRILTLRLITAVFSFTLFVTTLLTTCPAHALEDGSNPANASLGSLSSQAVSKIQKDETNRRLSIVTNYLRQQAPAMMPALPEAIRAPARWAMDSWSSIHSTFSGLDTSGLADGGTAIAQFLAPVSNIMRPPSDSTDSAIWVTPGYHHKGFIPTHDAMVLGFNTRNRVMNGTVQLDTHPFVGQNWHSSESYWGVESTLALAQPTTKPNGKPWGKISLRYLNGDRALMDHDRGFDMHTELRFDDHISLHAGVREDIGSGVGNYVMLRWQLTELGE